MSRYCANFIDCNCNCDAALNGGDALRASGEAPVRNGEFDCVRLSGAVEETPLVVLILCSEIERDGGGMATPILRIRSIDLYMF